MALVHSATEAVNNSVNFLLEKRQQNFLRILLFADYLGISEITNLQNFDQYPVKLDLAYRKTFHKM